MGMCDPKAIRNGKAWADVVNTPGFMQGQVNKPLVGAQFVGHNKSSVNKTKGVSDDFSRTQESTG